MLWEVYMDFSFDMGIWLLVSLELLRKLQKKDLRKPNSVLMAKSLVASKWRQRSFSIKLDADWLISGCLNNLITVRQKSETSIFLDSPLCLTLKMNYSYWRTKKWKFSFTEGKFFVWLQTAIIYAAPLNTKKPKNHYSPEHCSLKCKWHISVEQTEPTWKCASGHFLHGQLLGIER